MNKLPALEMTYQLISTFIYYHGDGTGHQLSGPLE